MDPKEHIVCVYGETLTREDFLTLGLQNYVEAMVRQWSNMHSCVRCVICIIMDSFFVPLMQILNSCLRVIAQIGSIRVL